MKSTGPINRSLAAMCLVISLCCTACTKDREDLRGQVFVVTKGRENIKMGLVAIHIVDDHDFRRVSESTLAKLHLFEIEFRNKELELNSDRQALESLERRIDNMNPSGIRLDRLVTLVQEVRNYRDALLPPPRVSMNLATDVFFGGVPKSVTRTNADGMFQTNLYPNGDFWVIARAERSVGDGEEQYLWISRVEQSMLESNQLVLVSNDSLIDSPESLKIVLESIVRVPAPVTPTLRGTSKKVSQWIVETEKRAEQILQEAKEEEKRLEAERVEAQKQQEAKAELETAAMAAAQKAAVEQDGNPDSKIGTTTKRDGFSMESIGERGKTDASGTTNRSTNISNTADGTDQPRSSKEVGNLVVRAISITEGANGETTAFGNVEVLLPEVDGFPGIVFAKEAWIGPGGNELVFRGKPLLHRGMSVVRGTSEQTVIYIFKDKMKVVGPHKLEP